MTFKTNARVAGFMFLFYTATTVAQGVVLGRAISGAGVAAKLASISRHATSNRWLTKNSTNDYDLLANIRP